MLSLYAVIFAVCVAADLVTKALICPPLIAGGGKMPLIPGIIGLEYTQNTGMAWGLMKNSTLFLTLFSVIACLGIIFFVIKKHRSMPSLIGIAFTLVVAGAAGNLFDRIALGYVRDFITFQFIDFPIFNVADCFVTVGAALLIAGVLLTKKGREFYKSLDFGAKKKKNADAAESKAADDGAKTEGE